MVKKLKIEGMSCEHCQRAVTNALNDVKGVGNAIVDLDKKTAVVEITTDVTNEILIEAVTEEGYQVLEIIDIEN